MKRIVSLLLAGVMMVSAVPVTYAADTQDHSLGTQVVFTAANNENYTITVPASLNPGQSGTVTLDGYWPDSKTVTVTAEKTVTLKNSIKAADTKTLNVTFLGISEAGSNTSKQTFTEPVSVEGISNALFGTWSGKFNYNVDVENATAETGCDTLYWDGTVKDGIIVDVGSDEFLTYMSDVVLTESDLTNGYTIGVRNNDGLLWEETLDDCDIVVDDIMLFGMMYSCAEDNATMDVEIVVGGISTIKSVTFPKKGLYIMSELEDGESYVLTIPGYTGFPHSEHCGH